MVVVHLPAGRLASFRGHGWVALEATADEQEARARFHALKPAFERLTAEAVLMKAVVHPDLRVEVLRTLMSKDAEFWRLKSAEIGVASREQVKEWRAATTELLTVEAGKALARLPVRPNVETSSRTAWTVAAVCAVAVICFSVAATVRFAAPPVAEAPRTNTIFLSDPRDLNIVVEYAVADDGSRRAIRRLTREELKSGAPASPEHTNATAKPKSLADGINVFLRVRQ